MIAAVALVFAAATAAASPSPSPVVSASPSPVVSASPPASQPFTAPAGWTQMPSTLATQVRNAWVRSLSGNQTATFAEVLIPIPSAPNTSTAAVSKTITLCGLPATKTTATPALAGKHGVLESEVVSRGGYTFMLVYLRPQNSSADPAIEKVMAGFCPSEDGQLPPLPIPANWKASPANGFQQKGMWLGSRPLQTMLLMQGPKAASLGSALAAAQTPGSAAKSIVTVKSRKKTTLCGLPALLVDLHVAAPSMPMDMHAAVTQNNSKLFLLIYLHPSSEAADPAALKSLQTLCAAPSP